MVLTASFVLSPVIGLFCHRHRRICSADLTPASRRQDHTTSPSTSSAVRPQRYQRLPHPAPNVRDDRETPLQRDGMARDIDLIRVRREQENFCNRDWTTRITLMVLAVLSSRRTPEIFGERAVGAAIIYLTPHELYVEWGIKSDGPNVSVQRAPFPEPGSSPDVP